MNKKNSIGYGKLGNIEAYVNILNDYLKAHLDNNESVMLFALHKN